MFNWLRKKMFPTQEEQMALEVENIVEAMKDSTRIKDRWVVELYKEDASYRYEDSPNFWRGYVYVLHMKDVETQWEMSVTLWLNMGGYFVKRWPETRKAVAGDLVTSLEDYGSGTQVCSVEVMGHSEYAYMPSREQLKDVYLSWWKYNIEPEVERRAEERERKRMEEKQQGLIKLKALYGKRK